MSPRATAWGAYKVIAAAIRTRLTSGEFAPGAPLPSEAALAAEYGVARGTLRRALDLLVNEGLIMSMPGVGRVVASAGDAVTPPVPLYRQMAADLQRMIETNELRAGDALPSEASLAQRYGVARGTARHALTELQGAGLVQSRHGRGRFVTRPAWRT